jgi:hypothetical protein
LEREISAENYPNYAAINVEAWSLFVRSPAIAVLLLRAQAIFSISGERAKKISLQAAISKFNRNIYLIDLSRNRVLF